MVNQNPQLELRVVFLILSYGRFIPLCRLRERGGPPFCQVALKTNFQASHKLYLKTKLSGVVESPYQVVSYNNLKGPSTVRQALFITTIFCHACDILSE